MAIAACTAIGAGVTSAQECDPVEAAKLLADEGASSDQFGYSVALSGDTAILGTIGDNDNGNFSGSAYVFTRSESEWLQQTKLLPDDGMMYDQFGHSVSIYGDTAIIGAIGDDDNGTNSGSVYVFTRNGGVWMLQAKLLPPDDETISNFGFSVSINGDTAVIGAQSVLFLDHDNNNSSHSGSAYVFTRNEGVWTLQAKLLPSDGMPNDAFGWSVSISNDTTVIGAPLHDENYLNSGSAYVFTRSDGVWTQQAKLLPDDGAFKNHFGNSVSVSSDTTIIGAPNHDHDNSAPLSGSAYIFTRSEGAWTQQAELLPDDGAANDEFGFSVSISSDTAIIGAIKGDDNGSQSGSAYIFTRSESVWTEQAAELLPSDGATGDQFGFSVSISGDTALIGANLDDDDNGTNSGSAYVFDLGCSDCPADLNGDGLLDFFDLQIFLNWYAEGDLRADFVADGALDFYDVQEYLNLYSAGCP